MPPSAFLRPFARPADADAITIVRGEGAAVFDDKGTRYVDALASLWYCNVGHGRPEIADAVAAQMHTLENFNTFDRYTNPPAEELCTLLAGLAPMEGARVFLTCSGSEAVDSALKLARVAQVLRGEGARTVFVSRRFGYHGVTYGGLSVQGLPPNQEGFGPFLPDVINVSHDDLDEMAAAFADHGDRIAAVIAEPVIGAGGVYPPPPGYLEGLRRLCTEHGAFLILDEVITGFGRLGAWWAAATYDVKPDMVTFAKAVTSGYQPLGGVLVGPAVRAPLEADPAYLLRHGHTYSGHPTACAAALANLSILSSEHLIERAVPIGDRIEKGLEGLRSEGVLAGLRGAGAVWAALLNDDSPAAAVRDAMLTHGVIARPIGASVIAMCPPLVIGDDDIDRCIDAIGASVRAVRAR